MTQGVQLYEAQASGGNSADVILKLANVQLGSVPAADPHVAGQLWLDSGTLKVSTG